MEKYELAVLYHPDLEIDLDKALKKVEDLIKKQKGKIVSSDNWGKRKLAYPIKKEDHAIYVFYKIELSKGAIIKLEANLNITDEVLRYLLVKFDPEKEKEKEDSDSDSDDSKTETKKKSKEAKK